MEFRFLTESDAEDISRFIHDVWVDTYAPIVKGGREWAERIFDNWVGPERIRKDMAMGYFYADLVVGDDVVGLASAGKEGDAIFISKLYIMPEFRRRGYGQQALDLIFDLGREQGCTSAKLQVNPRNEAAISFYKKYGFRTVGRNEYERGYTDVMSTVLRRP